MAHCDIKLMEQLFSLVMKKVPVVLSRTSNSKHLNIAGIFIIGAGGAVTYVNTDIPSYSFDRPFRSVGT